MEYNEKAAVDLHIHSNASDGTFSPQDILDKAKQLGLRAISITDHDTLEGSRQAIKHNMNDAIRLITGVEISADLPREYGHKGSCHILGYGIDLENPKLNETLSTLQNARKNRNPLIIEKLNAMNIWVTMADVLQMAPDNQVGRPHIAEALVKKGYACSISDAFDRYLGVDQPAYVDKYRISCSTAISIIDAAGGIAVLAHPYLLKPNKGPDFEKVLKFLTSKGIKGIEVYYSEHTREATQYYKEIADEYGLIATGGSDFHGTIRPDIQMGTGCGDLCVPYHAYEQLVTFIQNHRLSHSA